MAWGNLLGCDSGFSCLGGAIAYAVAPAGAVGVDFAATLDGLQRSLRAAHQHRDGDGDEHRVEGAQPQKIQWRVMRVGERPLLDTHVDDQLHPQIAQTVVIGGGWSGTNEQVIGNVRKIHA